MEPGRQNDALYDTPPILVGHQGPTLSTRIEAYVDIKLFSSAVVEEIR
jgi:hypothetical protein